MTGKSSNFLLKLLKTCTRHHYERMTLFSFLYWRSVSSNVANYLTHTIICTCMKIRKLTCTNLDIHSKSAASVIFVPIIMIPLLSLKIILFLELGSISSSSAELVQTHNNNKFIKIWQIQKWEHLTQYRQKLNFQSYPKPKKQLSASTAKEC